MPRKRRYTLSHPELNEQLDTLLDRASERYGNETARPVVREIIVSALRLLRDGASRGDLLLASRALKELRHAFRVFRPYSNVRKVAVFGSARTQPGSQEWDQAFAFAKRVVESGWMVITGAGGGVMEAAQRGAGREASFGVNIQLPFEQLANETIAGDPKLINFRYFFTRKVTFVKEAHAFVLLPGGFGTLDEGFEALTLIQTGKSEILPVVFLDRPGGSYWRGWHRFIRAQLERPGWIGKDDFALFKVTDDLEEAIQEIENFYSNYHSSRYVNGQLVIRVRVAPDEAQLAALNNDFADMLTEGPIEIGTPLEEEAGEGPGLQRLLLSLDRRRVGRLRQLIDRLNELVREHASSPGEALPHEIVAWPISADGLRSQEEEEA
jgi:uncharacterized protein (TIGR00730 family)